MDLMAPGEVARELGLARYRVTQFARSGKYPLVRDEVHGLYGRWLWPRSSVEMLRRRLAGPDEGAMARAAEEAERRAAAMLAAMG